MVSAEISDNCVGFVKSMPRLLNFPAFKAVVEGHVKSPLDLTTVLLSARTISMSRLACDQAVAIAYQDALTHTAVLTELAPIQEFAQTWDVQAYKEKDRNMEQFRLDMMVLRCLKG